MKKNSERPAGHAPYATPSVEALEIAVEHGFAASFEDPLKEEDPFFWN